MGSNTTGDITLYKPAVGETGWGTLVNGALDEIDAELTRLRKGIWKPEAAFADADTTPSVSSTFAFRTANSSPTSITTFDDGTDDQVIQVRVNDANTTFVDGSGIELQKGSNYAASSGDILMFRKVSSTWYELTPVSGYPSGTVDQGAIGAAAVGQGELKTSTEAESVSVSAGAIQLLAWSSVSSYGLYPTLAITHTGTVNVSFYDMTGSSSISGVYMTVAPLAGSCSGTATIRYVQSSPPNEFLVPDEDWGQFLALGFKGGELVRSWTAGDPPWQFASRGRVGKRDQSRFFFRPNPFARIGEEDTPDVDEVLWVDLRPYNKRKLWVPSGLHIPSRLRSKLAAAGIQPIDPSIPMKPQMVTLMEDLLRRSSLEGGAALLHAIQFGSVPDDDDWRALVRSIGEAREFRPQSPEGKRAKEITKLLGFQSSTKHRIISSFGG